MVDGLNSTRSFLLIAPLMPLLEEIEMQLLFQSHFFRLLGTQQTLDRAI
jgi:hypothetical protein